ncbi:hypothetical protein [Caulobacter vibrioides]|uniref:hypothetical protein n=1 Tax=Caulobacter vibrioides TaxID=155892 RepID=UPI000BB4965A|nr:hypothetical protein [Caulobacter vibrioides]ATC23820.1 hypothetical protein CA608_04365 [Caulobacter vibrioides]PLR15970.1 hypothetical protein CVUC_02440 [Caulobacter vibrioides]
MTRTQWSAFGAAVLTFAFASAALAADNGKAAGEASLARELNGRVPGQPVSCIVGRTISDTWVVERTAILYRMRDGTVYVSRPIMGAQGLARDAVLGGTGPRALCQGDGVGLVSPGGKGVRGLTAVRLGAFTPYTRP